MDIAALAALAVVAGAVVATGFRDGRAVILGLSLAAVAAALVTSPAPGFLAVAARFLGALAAAYLLWAAVASDRVHGFGSAIGLPAEAALGVAAFVIGLAIRPVDPLAGPATAQAAGLAVVALAVVPLAGRDVFRLGAATMLLAIGCSLLLGAWSGPTPPLQHLALSALLIGIAGATCLLAPDVAAAVQVEPAAAPARVPEPRLPAAVPERAAAPRPAAYRQPLPAPHPSAAPVRRPAPAAPARASEPEWPEPARPETAARAPAAPAPAAPPPATPPAAPARTWTADPAADEWDSWAAWHTPEPDKQPEPRSRPTRRARPDSDKGGGR
jgi:hypothetical protein